MTLDHILAFTSAQFKTRAANAEFPLYALRSISDLCTWHLHLLAQNRMVFTGWRGRGVDDRAKSSALYNSAMEIKEGFGWWL